jgi:hypothetical protein
MHINNLLWVKEIHIEPYSIMHLRSHAFTAALHTMCQRSLSFPIIFFYVFFSFFVDSHEFSYPFSVV